MPPQWEEGGGLTQDSARKAAAAPRAQRAGACVTDSDLEDTPPAIAQGDQDALAVRLGGPHWNPDLEGIRAAAVPDVTKGAEAAEIKLAGA